MSSGLSPVGPTYEAASVVITKYYKYCKATSISARREGSHENIDGETLLNQVYDEVCHSLSLVITQAIILYI